MDVEGAANLDEDKLLRRNRRRTEDRLIKPPKLPPSFGHMLGLDLDEDDTRGELQEGIGDARPPSRIVLERKNGSFDVVETEAPAKVGMNSGLVAKSRLLCLGGAVVGEPLRADPDVADRTFYGAKVGWRRNLNGGPYLRAVKWKE